VVCIAHRIFPFYGILIYKRLHSLIYRVFVSIDLKILNHTLEVSVIDNGSGVNEQEMHNIFNAFHSSKTEGMGLGLAICRSIIEAHNSQLKIQNNHPGCQFTFTLPLVSNTPITIEDNNT